MGSLWAHDHRAAVSVLDALPHAAFVVDDSGVVLHANPAAAHLLQRPAERLRGAVLSTEALDEPSRDTFVEGMRLATRGSSWAGDVVVAADGSLRACTVVVRSVPGLTGPDGSSALLVLLSDGGEAVRAHVSERLTRLARVAAELVQADSVESVSTIVVEHMAAAAGATVASLSLLVDPDTLSLVAMRGGRPGAVTRWAAWSVHDNTPAGVAVRESRAVVLNGRAEFERHFPDLETATDGERSLACLPLHIGTRCIGVATWSFPGRGAITDAELDFLTTMADTCAQALDRVRVTQQARDQSDKMRFLAESSVELSSSLDYEVTLSKVARLAVPWFADWCAISLEQEGELRTLAVAHVDPGKVEMALTLQRRFPDDPASETGSYGVLRSGRSLLVPEITDDMLTEAISDPEHLDLMRRLNLRSAMTVPLKVQDRVLGVVTWVAGDDGRRFDVDDLAFGEDLAHRAALAIDSAQLHDRLAEVATRLQRAVLPAALPDMAGWSSAVSYLQAGNSDAGGDFYDVTALPDGRVAVFVGDVMGRGVTAAAAMAQMRAAIRALVTVDPDPEAVLSALDRLFEHYEFHQLVTLVYAVADPSRDEVVVANAGHPPPVVRRADGSVEVVTGEPGLLLGAGGGARSGVTVALRRGDVLLGYTDGLVERRDEDIDTGLRRLVDSCAARPGDDLTSWLTTVVDGVRDARRDDDIAALALLRA